MTRAEYVTSHYHYQSDRARALLLYVGLVRMMGKGAPR